MARVHNFSAGPAALPREVLDTVEAELLEYRDTGRSMLELSHRSPAYDEVHEQARARLLRLLGAEDDFDALFVGGGARTQFTLVPMNLLHEGESASYLVTGRWAELACEAAGRVARATACWDGKKDGYRALPAAADYRVDPADHYLHLTSNNTLFGTQWHSLPEGAPRLIADVSSDILCRPLDLKRIDLLYAGAQKNLGPAGVTAVVVRKSCLERASTDLPDMLSYRALAAKRSLLNTPPVFAIYVMNLVLGWLEGLGGVEAMARRNEAKAERLYSAIDSADGFYRGHAELRDRSLMNVTFRLASVELEARFLGEASAQGFEGLKGHRSVGGIRASIYNAVTPESVEALAEFLGDFAGRNG